jgi:hypothetical protein
MKISFTLTAEQAEQAEAIAKPGTLLIGNVHREPFDGSNTETAGRWVCSIIGINERIAIQLRKLILDDRRKQPC